MRILRCSLLLIAFCLQVTSLLLAQAPVINSISSQVTYPGDKLVITGAGFNTDPTKMRVWFGSVAGKVLKSSGFSVEVLVPPEARVSNIEVINTQTGLSVRSNNRFAPWFSGSGFSTSAFVAPPYASSGDFRQFKSSGSEYYDICSCDFDGDGKPDLASSKYEEKSIRVLRNTSSVRNLSFTESDFSSGTQATDQILCGDLNGDGLPEIVASPTDKVNKTVVTIFPNRSIPGAISFGAAQQLALPDINSYNSKAYVRTIVIRDLNNDGKPELVFANSGTSQGNISPFYIYLNQSSGQSISFNPLPVEIELPRYKGTYSLEIQDFDGDRLPDIAIGEYQSEAVYFFPNKSTNFISFGTVVTKLISGASINKLSSADFNGDGKSDLAVADFFSGSVDVFLNNSSGGSISFGDEISNEVAKNPGNIDVTDIDGDQDIDLVATSRFEAKITFLINNGSSTPTFTRSELLLSKTARSIYAGDLDGDAKPDLALVAFNTLTRDYTIDVLRNKSCFVPKIINEQPLINCPGQSILLESVPGYGVSYDWKSASVSIGTTDTPLKSVSRAGSYSVTALGECSSSAATSPAVQLQTKLTGNVPAQPPFNGIPLVCEGSELSFSTSLLTNATYEWTGPNGFKQTTNEPNLKRTGVTGSMAGEYGLQVISSEGCKSEVVNKVFEVVGLSNFNIVSSSQTNTICEGSQLSLSVANFSGYNYQWKKDDVNVSGSTTVAIQVTAAGRYTVTVSSSSLPTCAKTTSAVQVSLVERPFADFKPPAPVCTGGENIFENTSDLKSGSSVAEFNWNFGPGGTSKLKTPDKVNFPAGVTNVDVTLSVTFKGIDGCLSTKLIPLVVKQTVTPKIDPEVLAVCPESPQNLTVSGTFQSFLWSTGDSSASIVVNKGGEYSVITTDLNGCKSSAVRNVTGLPVPVVEVTASSTKVASGEVVNLTASGADSWQWEPAELLDDAVSATPVARPLVTTKFFVSGFLKDGCSARDSVEVQVEGDFKLPNTFSPNGDGVNDFWELPSVESFSDCILAIFDRSGRRVFEQLGYSNNWEGNSNGKPLPEGVYFYVMGCPNRPPITGSVLIAR